MPTFNFINTETGEKFEDFLSNSKKEELLEKNPHIRQLPSAFSVVTMTGSLDSKTDNTWKEVLAKVAEAHPDSNVGQRYGKKSIKQIKTDKIVEKHIGKWKNN
jgi:hypothetical protein